MKPFFRVPTLLALGLASWAQAAEFNAVQGDKSSLIFIYKQMGVPVEGRFKKFSARLNFDPARPGDAGAAVDVDLAGIDTGSSEADDEVLGKAWFNAKAFPQARFVSTGVKPLGGNRYEVAGKMTIKGRTQDVVVPFTVTPQGSAGLLEGAIVLKRAEFAIGEGVWADFGTVANEVQIKFRFLANAGK